MAVVIGPNGLPNEIPDEVAACLVGDGQRGYAYAPEPAPASASASAPKRAPRRTTSK